MEDDPRRLRGLRWTTVAGRRVRVADSFAARLLGLAFLPAERAGPGLLLPRCRSVHTFGMRFALDILFLDPDGRVIERRDAVPPGRVVAQLGAASTLELPTLAVCPGPHARRQDLD